MYMSYEIKGKSVCRLYDQMPFLILHACELGERKIEREKVLCWCRHVEHIGISNAVEG